MWRAKWTDITCQSALQMQSLIGASKPASQWVNDPPNRHDWQVASGSGVRFFRWERLVAASFAVSDPVGAMAAFESAAVTRAGSIGALAAFEIPAGSGCAADAARPICLATVRGPVGHVQSITVFLDGLLNSRSRFLEIIGGHHGNDLNACLEGEKPRFGQGGNL
jgi:hypothetical protein